MAYTTAIVSRVDANADGRLTNTIRYTGNAGEPPVEYAYPVDAQTLPDSNYLRGQAMQRIAVLNNNRAYLSTCQPLVGTQLDTTTALPAAPASTFGQFAAASLPFTPGATPQDVFAITGSATKTIRVVSMGIASLQTTAGINTWSIVKRSTANTGGTSAAVAAVSTSSLYPAATATVLQYTGNPVAGTLLGRPWVGRVVSPTVATATAAPLIERVQWDTPIELIGTGHVLAWNFNGVALPAGLSVTPFVLWTEL